MKARIDYYCKPKIKNAGYTAEDISINVELAFIPTVGVMLKVTPNGEYLRVKDVHFDVNADGEGLVIGVDNEPLWPWKAMKAEGWRLG